MWYYYKRLNKRRKRIVYYRRHQKFKEETVGIVEFYRSLFSVILDCLKPNVKTTNYSSETLEIRWYINSFLNRNDNPLLVNHGYNEQNSYHIMVGDYDFFKRDSVFGMGGVIISHKDTIVEIDKYYSIRLFDYVKSEVEKYENRKSFKKQIQPVGDNSNKPNNNEFWITHVKYIGLDGGGYFTKGRIYKVVGEKRYWNGYVFCEIETDVNEETHRREFFKNRVRKHEEEFELIYNNEL